MSFITRSMHDAVTSTSLREAVRVILTEAEEEAADSEAA